MEILRLMGMGLQSFAYGITNFVLDSTFIINPIALLVVIIVTSQYRNLILIQKQMYNGKVRNRLRDLVSSSLLAGILAGFAGSIIITVLGITFLEADGLILIVIMSLLLMFFVNPRYACISYSGGIISIVSLVFTAMISTGILNLGNSVVSAIHPFLNLDVTALMIVIAIIHLVEAILMWIDGHRGAVPVFMKHEGRLVGGFVMQRLWIMPLIFFILMKSQDVIGQTIPTPDWWPLIGPVMTREQLRNAVFGAIPLLSMLGYNDFSITTPVKSKVRRSSVELLVFGMILMSLALISYKIYVFKYIAALFAPIAHEFIIIYGRYKEAAGVPIWGPVDDGVIVVDTIPKSPAETIGIKSGDKVIGINNNPVRTIEDMIGIMSNYINYMWIEVISLKGEKRTLEFANYQSGIDELGIITVPSDDQRIVVLEADSRNIFKGIMKIFKRGK